MVVVVHIAAGVVVSIVLVPVNNVIDSQTAELLLFCTGTIVWSTTQSEFLIVSLVFDILLLMLPPVNDVYPDFVAVIPTGNGEDKLYWFVDEEVTEWVVVFIKESWWLELTTDPDDDDDDDMLVYSSEALTSHFGKCIESVSQGDWPDNVRIFVRSRIVKMEM